MLTNLTGPSELFIADLDRIENTLTKANQQVSSGKRIAVASDAPDDIQSLLQLRADQEQNTQIESNLSLANTEAQSGDGALSSAIQFMDRALTLASQGATGTQTADTRASIAQEIEGLQAEMVSASQTMVQGRYIFSGDQDGAPSYQLDLNSANGVDLLSASPATRQVEEPGGGSFTASLTAQAIFDDRNADGSYASDNVFAALNNLRVALLANDQRHYPGHRVAPTGFAAPEQFGRCSTGAVEDRLQNDTSFAQSQDVALATQISQKEDADIPTAAMELTQGNTELQAAFEMQAKMPTTTLFSFLG